MRRLTAYVHGDVQGVGYRSRVVAIARDLGLVGFIRNLPDGRAKVTAEGGTESLERFIKAIKIDNALIKVDEIDYEYSEPTREFESFYKLVGKGETDERLDNAAKYLKELISVTKNGFSDLKGVIIDESQKTRETVRDESQKTRETVRDESQKTRDELGGIIKDESQKTRDGLGTVIKDESRKTREEMRSTFGASLSKIEDDVDRIKDGIGRR
ncbi:MAG: acylphosphatase [Archaeoglobaceae archaeon]